MIEEEFSKKKGGGGGRGSQTINQIIFFKMDFNIILRSEFKSKLILQNQFIKSKFTHINQNTSFWIHNVSLLFIV